MECVKTILGICTRTETKIEYYDFTDVKVRVSLIDKGFTAQVIKNVLLRGEKNEKK